MNADELEAEGNRLVDKFLLEFENICRSFYREMKVFAAQVEASPASAALKAAVMASLMAGMDRMDEVTDRVSNEEGVA